MFANVFSCFLFSKFFLISIYRTKITEQNSLCAKVSLLSLVPSYCKFFNPILFCLIDMQQHVNAILHLTCKKSPETGGSSEIIPQNQTKRQVNSRNSFIQCKLNKRIRCKALKSMHNIINMSDNNRWIAEWFWSESHAIIPPDTYFY